MQLLNGETINLFLYIFGLFGLIIILVYTAFASEDVEQMDEESS